MKAKDQLKYLLDRTYLEQSEESKQGKTFNLLLGVLKAQKN